VRMANKASELRAVAMTAARSPGMTRSSTLLLNSMPLELAHQAVDLGSKSAKHNKVPTLLCRPAL
jgi:hypothetical protein